MSLINPVVYLISGFRWSFYGHSDVNPAVSLGMALVFLVACLGSGGVDLPHGVPAQELTFLRYEYAPRAGMARLLRGGRAFSRSPPPMPRPLCPSILLAALLAAAPALAQTSRPTRSCASA